MARKKKIDEEPCGNWMDTYGDMVTLLLTFFVMLFSMSSVDKEKFEILVKAFTNSSAETQQIVMTPEGQGNQLGTNQGDAPPPGDGEDLDLQKDLPKDFDELYQYLKAYIKQNGMEGSVEVTKGDGAVFIRFEDSIFFNPDSFQLKSLGNQILDFLGNCLKNVEEEILTININGHTAAVPNVENYRISDWRLSSERASSVAIYFEEQKGIPPKKLLPIGYGKNFPRASNDTVEGRKKNRRVDMMIISEESTLTDEEILKTLLAGTFDDTVYPKAGSSKDILVPQNLQKDVQTESESMDSEQPPPDLQQAESSETQQEESSLPSGPYDALEPVDSAIEDDEEVVLPFEDT